MPSPLGKPWKVLILATNPPDTEHLNLGEEVRRIREALKPPSAFEVHDAQAARIEDLEDLLMELRPRYVHFCGHGQGDSGLVFHGGPGFSRTIVTERLEALFAALKGNIHCVFLNCCLSLPQAEAIGKHIPYVVGTKKEFADEVAIEFSRLFYRALGLGKTVPQSFQIAKTVAAGTPEAQAPVLISKRRLSEKMPSGSDPPVNREYAAVPRNGIKVIKGDRRRAARQARREPALQPLDELVLALRRSREAVIFLGPDSAREGRKGSEPYPTLEQLARGILGEVGLASEDRAELLIQLRNVLRRWEDEASGSDYLSDFLVGEPGPAHYYLAAFALSIFPHWRILLFIGTGFDDLLAEAFHTIQRGESRTKANVIRLDSAMTADFRQIHREATVCVSRGEPVLLKLYGNLGAKSPLLSRKTNTLQGALHEDWLRGPMICIGCDLEDKLLQHLLLQTPKRGPVFIVGTGAYPSRIRKARAVYHIPMSFGTFVTALITALQAKEEDRAILERLGEYLCRVPPQDLYPDWKSVARRAEVASGGTLSRAQLRLPRSDSDERTSRLAPITRLNTGPDLASFLADQRPLLAVIGDSGTGKSTLFYQMYHTPQGHISLFYDAHEIDPKDSLSRRIAHDFFCDEAHLERSLEEIGRVLLLSSKKLLILVDGINETQKIPPAVLKSEIEGLARRLRGKVKIAYSCRKVYWDNYIASGEPLPTELYFGSKEFVLHKFSPEETEEAFRVYQELYGFRGTFLTLSSEFRERLSDPLMLRMLAEGYQGKPLPLFAPAVLIFDTYLERFHRLFKGTVLRDFLDLLLKLKLQEADSGRASDQFHATEVRTHPQLSVLIQQQLNGPKRRIDPLILLEDEGILTTLNQEATIYRFTYDRFFEYLLGRALPMQQVRLRRQGFPQYLREQIQKLSQQQFWFLQALKSELIRLNIRDPDGPWSLYDPATVRSLLEDPDAQVPIFTKDTLRELVFEGERDLANVLESACADASTSRLLMLDIAPDSPQVLPLLIHGLTDGDKALARRGCYILMNLISTPEHREMFEASLLREMNNAPMNSALLAGLVYYSAVLFSEADRKSVDPFHVVLNFWRSAWASIGSRPDAEDVLTAALIRVVRDEAGQFFGNSKRTAMDYLWTWMTPEVKDLALRMLPLLVDPELPVSEDMLEILLFFSSCIRDWSNRKEPRLENEGTYKLEYLIVRWILLLRGRNNFAGFKETLERFISTGFTRTIEVALTSLEQACLLFFRGQGHLHLLRDAEATLREWTEIFRQTGEGFYWPLAKKDPLSLNESPLEAAARVAMLDEVAPGDGPNPFLEKWITDSDRRHVLFALICAKGLWREKPSKILATLDLVADSDDETVTSWLNRILKEIYLVYPRLVEDFFWRNRNSFGPHRIQEIKHRSDIRDPSRVSHNGTPLSKAVFMTSVERREKFAAWYKRLLQSTSLEDFCEEWVHSFVAELESA